MSEMQGARATVTQLSEFREHHGRAAAVHALAQPAWAVPEALPAPPPTGTVTFLLTDIEGSTPRWEAAPDAMAEAVGRHYEILDAAVAAHGGVRPIEQGEGDSMVAAFARASDAAAAALQAQRALVAQAWPEGADVPVRMALHTGEARLREGLYYVGPSIIRCARLRSLAHGGQVLLSATAADLLVDGLPGEAALLPLGAHRLKGMRHPERVFQLAHPALPTQFPPLASIDMLPTNLLAQLTTFIGRDAELAEVTELMVRHRLVTLAGAGGTGKTRLALQAAGEVPEAYPDGIWWVELAPVADPDLVPRAVMAAVGLDDTRGLEPLARTVEFLAGRRVLLVLDNCEHVTAAAAEVVGAVLAACPGVSALATSREPLAVRGEVVWRVPPLSLAGTDDAGSVLPTEAVQLFAERAAEARPGFKVDATNAAVVADLCARLDGLPLAIELAAARIRALTPQRILDGLAQRFALLTGGGRGGVPHHQTLAASMDWSHDLLTEPQQVLLRRLAVFVGRFTLEAVEEVGAAEPLSPWECLVLLADLVDRSLVTFDGEHYALLQTVRDFAAAKLAAAGEVDVTRAAHVAHYAALAAEAAAEIEVAPLPGCLDRIEHARTNLLAAIAAALATGDVAAAQGIAADLCLFWAMHGRYSESLACLRGVLAATPDEPTPARVRVLWAIGLLGPYGMEEGGGYGIAENEAAIAAAAVTGQDDVLGRALGVRCFVQMFGQPAAAAAGLPEAQDLVTRAGDRFGVTLTAMFGALIHCFATDDAAAAAPHLAALAAEAAATGSPYWAGWHALSAGIGAHRAGRLREAVALLAGGVEAAWSIGDPLLDSWCTAWLADAHIDLGDFAAAERAVSHSTAWQDRSCVGRAEFVLERRARIAVAQGDPAAATAHLDAVEPLLLRLSFPFHLAELSAMRARIALTAGDPSGAAAAAGPARAVADAIGTPWYIAAADNLDGRIARARSDLPAAEDAHHRALAIGAERGFAGVGAETLECLASLATAGESWAEAARLYGAAGALRANTGQARPPVDSPTGDADLAALAAALGAGACAAAYEEGGRLTFAEAVAYASRARGERKRPSMGWASLTPTEHQVVALVAAGLTNPDIGRRLFITTGTVKVHVHTIFGKLGVTRRAELAARATERRLTADG